MVDLAIFILRILYEKNKQTNKQTKYYLLTWTTAFKIRQHAFFCVFYYGNLLLASWSIETKPQKSVFVPGDFLQTSVN